MPTTRTKRYCADPEALAAMQRDGLGWGHDLECGFFQDFAPVPRPHLLTRFTNKLKRKS